MDAPLAAQNDTDTQQAAASINTLNTQHEPNTTKWLNDKIINTEIKHFQNQSPFKQHRNTLTSFQTTQQIIQKQRMTRAQTAIQQWTKRKILIIPIHSPQHWLTIIRVTKKEKGCTLIHADSLKQTKIGKLHIRKQLQERLKHTPLYDPKQDKWEELNIMKQGNAYDCGIVIV